MGLAARHALHTLQPMSIRHVHATLISFAVGLLVPLSAAPSGSEATLTQAAQGLFHVGAAINAREITEKDRKSVALIERHFDSVTPENALKWMHVHPKPQRYDFKLADQYVEFGQKRGMAVIGHTLMWHSQTPAWVFEDEAGKPISREALLARLRDHVTTVVGRYRGRIKGWDVVNEAIRDEDGQLRTEKPWYRILGEEGIFAAFEAAHAADPDAELYYNDYSLDNPVKRAGVIKLALAIRARGLRIDGIGSQDHCLLEHPTIEQVDATYRDIAAAGFKAMVTELDVSVLPRPAHYAGAEVSKRFENSVELDPYRDGLPADVQEKLARRYAELFAVYAKHHETITRVTVWGVYDRTSWLNNWPIRGRTDYAVLFDRKHQPKPAVAAVIETLQQARR